MNPPRIQVTALYRCPFCGRQIAATRQLRYPSEANLAPVYRCSCGKHSGPPKGK